MTLISELSWDWTLSIWIGFALAGVGLGLVVFYFAAQQRRLQAQLNQDLDELQKFKSVQDSKRKQAEEALAKEQSLVETLMEAFPDHIYFKDRESRFIRVNKAMAAVFKLQDPADAIGKTDFDFFLPEHARQAFEDEKQIMRTGESLVGREEKETWPDGSVTWASTTKLPLRDASGTIIGTFGLSRDITDRKAAEQALAVKTQELVRSNSELEHFAYAASHDLQEPLRMVASYLQLLVRRCESQLTPEGKEFIGFAVDGAKRMQALINDLLLYSRVSRQAQPLVPVNCDEVLSRALANLRVTIQDNGAKVTHTPMPKVVGDATQLTQMFQNLIGNAIKFRSETPPVIHIGAEYKKTTPLNGIVGEWLFSVSDNGIGIEKQYFDRIFLIFQRLHTREKYPGTGIGLAICSRIAERHSGRIWVESTPGKGSIFFFTIAQPEGGAM
jgi:PAS domain S-box-containing protein